MEENDKFRKNKDERDHFAEEPPGKDPLSDDIPVEELNIKAKQEKNKRRTQDSSLNEQKDKLEEMWTNRIKR